jgi:hypothetical protein
MVTQPRIVFLNSRNHLTDTTGHDCRYRTADGQPLLPGYWYRVSWPDDVQEPRFDGHAHYSGPYDSEEAATNAFDENVSSVSRVVPIWPMGDADSSQPAEVAFFPDWHCGR